MSDTWHDKYIVEESDGWYFWDEVGQESCGPFKDMEEAIQKHLFMEKAQERVLDYVASLRTKAKIEVLY